MKQPMRMAAILFLVAVAVHLAVIGDYSINWDFHHVFFGGLYHTGHPVGPELVKHIPFTDPDPKRMVETPFGPFQTALPALSYEWLYERMGLLAFDSAFSLPAVVFGLMGILVLGIFTARAFTPPTGILAAFLLFSFPRYFGDMHTNIKDVPTAAWYAVSIFAAWRMVNSRKLADVLLAAAAFAVTFNFKINAVFIPFIIGAWILSILILKTGRSLKRPLSTIKSGFIAPLGGYFVLLTVFAVGIWSLFWDNPIDHLFYTYRFYQWNTVNMEVLLDGSWYCSAVNVPWHYPLTYLSIVTPIPTLALFIIGVLLLVYRSIIRKEATPLLFLLWFAVPLSRYLNPKIGVIDGIRHFEEIVFPLSAIAASGGIWLWKSAARIPGFRKPVGRIISSLAVAGIAFWQLLPLMSYHPYQLSYYNELVGGVKGALGRYDIDYWGISQKEAVAWVNSIAPENAVVHIAMSADTAAKYLRPDLLVNVNTTAYDAADYVIVLNRQSFFYRYAYLWEYFLRRTPAHTVTVRDVPLAWVYDNSLPPVERQPQWWQGEDPCVRKYW